MQINHPVVGRVSYQVGRGGALILDAAWRAQNIGVIDVAQLKGVPTFGAAFSGRVMFYRKAGPQLQAAFRVVEKLGLKSRVIFWAGSFVPRFKRGSTTSPSNHTWGTAFDINHQQNPFRRPIAAKGEYGSVVELLPIFREFGFECGADWRPENRDGMHFEIERLMTLSKIAQIEEELTGQSEVVVPKPQPLPEAPLLVWNDIAYPALFDAKERPHLLLAALTEKMGHEIIGTSNRLDQHPPRFYVNSRPKG